MSVFVAAYDVSDDGRRVRVAKVLLRYGQRVQRSVFEVWLEPDQHDALRREIGPLLSAGDEFDLFPVDSRASRRRVRWQRDPHAWEPVVVV